MIPRIIHQSWKTNSIPQRWLGLQRSWQVLHPDYDYRFWTDDDNHEFVRRHHPELMDLYEGYGQGIYRAELARYLVLRRLGGLYIDMDFEALRPVDDLIAGGDLVFGLEPDSHAAKAPVRERGLSRIVCNAFMASIPGHPFWDHLLQYLQAARAETSVLDATGPFLLTRASESWTGAVKYVPASLLYPLDNQQIRALAPEAQRAAAGDAYAIHHWAGSWWREALLARARGKIAGDR